MIEIDCTPATVNRKVDNGYTGPRVTKAVLAVDAGLAVNPLGLQAQMMGGIMDGIAQALTYSLHLKNGNYLEGSWTTRTTRASGTHRSTRGDRDAADHRPARRRG